MKKIGLIGEDPNDTVSIQNLLQKRHAGAFQFKQLIKNRRGHQLDNIRVSQALQIEYQDYNPHLIIFIRDADGISGEANKLKKVQEWFDKLNLTVGNKGILLMNIFELEALILADIATFNKLYKTQINFTGNVMFKREPKEFLMQKTFKSRKKYVESHCPAIFSELSFDCVRKNCKYFDAFYSNLKTRLNLV